MLILTHLAAFALGAAVGGGGAMLWFLVFGRFVGPDGHDIDEGY